MYKTGHIMVSNAFMSQHNHEKENSEHKVVTVSIADLLSTRFTAQNVGSHHKCRFTAQGSANIRSPHSIAVLTGYPLSQHKVPKGKKLFFLGIHWSWS